MVERLKQIWSGFAETTTRQLTGKGVDNISTPRRADIAAVDSALLPEDFEGPAARAVEALHQELAAKRKKFGRKRKTAGTAAKQETSASMAMQTFNGGELIKGLKATAMRTERAGADYEAFLFSEAGRAVLKKTRKKRFWIF